MTDSFFIKNMPFIYYQGHVFNLSGLPMNYRKIISSIVFDEIDLEHESIIFKLDILKSHQGEYSALLWRLDSYTIKPSFYVDDDFVADEQLFVLDILTIPCLEEQVFGNENKVIDFVSKKLKHIFNKN